MESNRWWEMYFVRYVTGTVVGAVIVYLLMQKIGVDLPSVKNLKTENLIVLGALGFAYCYLSSAPIALLHAMRLIWGKKIGGNKVGSNEPEVSNANSGKALDRIKKLRVFAKRYFPTFTKWSSNLKGVDFQEIKFIAAVALFSFWINWIINQSLPSFGNSGMIVGAFIFFIFYVAWSLFLRTDGNDEWQAEYRRLSLARKEEHADFVQSYRHLREHGNAYFIVLLELLLALPLYGLSSAVLASGSSGSAVSADGADLKIGLLIWGGIFWVGSGVICWLLGNKLERFMIETAQGAKDRPVK